jgi:hypothetical protein
VNIEGFGELMHLRCCSIAGRAQVVELRALGSIIKTGSRNEQVMHILMLGGQKHTQKNP